MIFYLQGEKKDVNIFSVSLLALQSINICLTVNTTTTALPLMSFYFKQNTKTKAQALVSAHHAGYLSSQRDLWLVSRLKGVGTDMRFWGLGGGKK